MSGIQVPRRTVALIEQSRAIIEAKLNGEHTAKPRRIPRYMPDGEEVKTVEQAAVMMKVDPITAALYVMEAKSVYPELRTDAASFLEAKKDRVRHVRTPAGARRYGVPIGTPIRNGKPDLPDMPDAPKPKAGSDDTGKPEPKKDGKSNPLKSPAMDRLMKAHNSKGKGTGKGTPDDPINVKGDIMLAAKLLSEGKSVRLNKVDEVGTLLGKLNEMVQEAREKGDEAPTFDLCKVSVPKTNLFCAESKGIPRARMPQLGGKPRPGSRADELPRDKKGEVKIEDEFRKELARRGVKVEQRTVPANFLKASQNELDGPKVAGMSKAMEEGKVPDAPIFVTRDGYVIDGHHRWASKVAIDAKDGHLGDVTMPVEMLDMEIGEALDFANAFALDFGIMPKGLGSAAEGVKWLRHMLGVEGK